MTSIEISIATATPPDTAAARDLIVVELDGLDDLISRARAPSASKAACCLCPGLPISATPDARHKITRYRSNLNRAQVLCLDFDGASAEAWGLGLALLAEHEHGWTDSWSHAKRSSASPTQVWRHLFVRLAGPTNAAEYSASWTVLADLLATVGLEADSSKRRIEDAIYLGTATGSGEYGGVAGRPWPVSQPPPLELCARQPPRPAVRSASASTRASAYAAAIPAPACEPEFCSGLVKIKCASADEAEYRGLAAGLAARSCHSDGSAMLSAAHARTTQSKIDSLVTNDTIAYGTLEDRPAPPEDLDSWWARREQAREPAPPVEGVAAGEPAQARRPPIDVTSTDLALAELASRLADDPVIYRKGRRWARVDDGSLTELSNDELREHAVRTIGFVRRDPKGAIVDAGVAREICQLVTVSPLAAALARPVSVVTHDPVFVLTTAGLVISEPGYYRSPSDRHGGVLHTEGGMTVDRVPPSREAALAGLADLHDLFSDWPFATSASRAAAVACLLTVAFRAAIDGPCPCFVVSSNMRGAGKGLLLRVISILATGAPSAETVIAEDRSEQGKQIVALFRSGRRMIVLDEVKRLSAIHELDSIVTAWPYYASRTLGKSEVAESPATPVWCVAGNNVSVESDSVRRTLAIRLETDHAHPEDRDDFLRPDIVGHITRERGRYYAAMLAVVGYATTLGGEAGVRSFGSFESWSSLIRRGLVSLDGVDPLDSRADLGIDVVEHERASLLVALVAEHGPIRYDGLARLLPQLEEVGIDAKNLRYALRRERGVIVDGKRLDYTTDEHGKRWWRVDTVETPKKARQAGSPVGHTMTTQPPQYNVVAEVATPAPRSAPARPWHATPNPVLEARGGPSSLAIVDGTGTICRGYFGAPSIEGQGLLVLAREIQELRWAGIERIVVALDSRARVHDHRRELSSDYKANRRANPKPEGLIRQLDLASATCLALGVASDSDPHVEADDLIAYYALLALVTGVQRVTVVSIDKDLEQLATTSPDGRSIKLYRQGEVHGPAEIAVRRGVPVRHLDTYLAIVGDSSDNVRGVTGIGPKKAAALICEHGDLECILAAAADVPGATGAALARDADQARLARQLVKLRADLVSHHRPLPAIDPIAELDTAWLAMHGIVLD